MAGQPGLYYSPKGFRIDAARTEWVQTAPPKSMPALVTVYQSPLGGEGVTPALTVRVDHAGDAPNLATYVKRWMKDYPRLGFEVLSAKNVRVADQAAFALDLVSRESRKQLRQVIFLRQKTAVILNCRDDQKTFGKTLPECNEIIRTFRWTTVRE